MSTADSALNAARSGLVRRAARFEILVDLRQALAGPPGSVRRVHAMAFRPIPEHRVEIRRPLAAEAQDCLKRVPEIVGWGVRPGHTGTYAEHSAMRQSEAENQVPRCTAGASGRSCQRCGEQSFGLHDPILDGRLRSRPDPREAQQLDLEEARGRWIIRPDAATCEHDRTGAAATRSFAPASRCRVEAMSSISLMRMSPPLSA